MKKFDSMIMFAFLFIGSATVVSSLFYVQFAFAATPIVQMEDTTSTYGLSLHSGRPVHAEYVSNTSALVGDKIDTIVLKLRKGGSPTGTAEIGIFNSDLSVKKSFGTLDVTKLTTGYKEYTFVFPITQQPYQIQSGDRIGIKYTGGSSSNFVAVMTDKNSADPFDGTNTYHTYYSGMWKDFKTDDLYMILKFTNSAVVSDPPITPPPNPTPPPSLGIDKFGIKYLNPTMTDGREWFSTWNNGHSRTFYGAIDPDDKWFDTDHGEGKYVIDGNGKLTASGNYVRMYVHDPANAVEWGENLEITVYVTRKSETKTVSYSGLQIFARTNHGTIGDEDINLCDSRGYGGKVTVDGRWEFEKETAHHLSNGYASLGTYKPWNTMPKDTTVGVKYILRNMANNTNVKVELYRDMTGGLNGGTWEKMTEFVDNGKNWGVGAGACKSGVNPAMQLIKSYTLSSSETKKPELSVYARHEYGTMEYEKFSIREIPPLA